MPSTFQWWDFFTYGLAAIVATALAGLAVYKRRLNPNKKWWQWAGLGLVVAFFWFGYIMVLTWRADLVDRVECVTKHGLIMVHDGGTMPACAAVGAETDRVIAAWNNVPGISAADALDDGVMVFVKPLPFSLHTQPGKFAGFTKPHATAIAVGFDGRELSKTALGHELGHVILRRAGKDASETALKNAHDLYGIPY